MLGWVPNAITFSRLVVGIVAIGALIANLWIWGLLLVLYCIFSDFLDGWVARRYGLTSELGARYDPLVDKIVILGILGWGVVFLGLEPLFYVVIVVREVMIAVIREKSYVDLAGFGSNLMGKIKTIAQYILCLSCIVVAADWLVVDTIWIEGAGLLISCFTAWTGLHYLQELQRLRRVDTKIT